MTLVVLMERDASGRLHAYVQQRREDGGLVVKGTDILKDRQTRNIDAAKWECHRHIRTLFKLIDPPRIDFILPRF